MSRTLLWLFLGLFLFSPWPFGCVHPLFELYLTSGLVLLLSAWCGGLLLDPQRLMHGLKQAGWAWTAFVLFALLVGTPALLGDMASGGRHTAGDARSTWAINPAVEEWIARTSPKEREIWRSGEPIPKPNTSLQAGGLSLNPAGNYHLSLRLGMLALLFLCLASLESPRQCLEQLAWCATVVGSALALVSIVHKISPTQGMLYGYFEKDFGYGPFANRNHYPFFANVASGLTAGLLMQRTAKFGLQWRRWLEDSTTLWLIAGLVIQLAGLLMSLSRGGLASFLAAVTLCAILRLTSASRIPGFAVGSGILGLLVVGFLTWAGFDLFASRLMSLGEAEAYREDGRMLYWRVALQQAWQFPLFGSGGETFRYWETLIRLPGVTWNSTNAAQFRVDNEYLDVLCEYGLFAMLALVVFVGLVLRGIGRGVQHSGLLAGAFISVMSIALHSLVDFGLRTPAMAMFATAVAAIAYASRGGQQAALDVGSRMPAQEPSDRPQPAAESTASLATASWLPSLAALTLAGLALVLMNQVMLSRFRFAAAEQHQLSALAAIREGQGSETLEHLSEMVKSVPEDPLVRLEASRLALLASATVAQVSQYGGESQVGELELRRFMLEQAIQTRDLCPLAWEPPFWISQNAELFANGRSLEQLQIAHLLHPSNDLISYSLGREAQAAGESEIAYAAWRMSLTYSVRFLPEITAAGLEVLSTEEFLERVVPSDAAVLLRAADAVESLGYTEAARSYLERGSEVVDRQLESADDEQIVDLLTLAAQIRVQLDDYYGAIEYQRQAVRLMPMSLPLRLDLVDLLQSTGDSDGLQAEVRMLQLLHPDSPQVQRLASGSE